ncbi:MAG: polyphosphate polymerase domain-containing protein [Verrucomicrobiota bacterium]|nr:polyphosphate polymerase domain-containing protein [Verrucomicrobiota bacterium]
MSTDRLQLQRFELKYIIPEETALAIRSFVGSYLEIDEFGATLPNLSYPVHSLYLDSDDLSTYRSTINGDKNRYKLRLRFYDNRPEAPVFFEIKRRVNNTISKQRGGVRRDCVDSLLAGQLPGPQHLISKDPKQLLAIQNFCRLMMDIRATPKAHIFYYREAWISRLDNSVRVTMDRHVACDPEPTSRLSTELVNPVKVFGNKVVLELKFTNRFPDWFKELTRVFGLMQCGAAKYADGVALAGEHRIRQAFAYMGVVGENLTNRATRPQITATPALTELQALK